MSDLASLSISDMRIGLDSKDFSCSELVKACLDRADATKSLNCFTMTTADEALKAAGTVDSLLAEGKRGGRGRRQARGP